MAPSSTSGAMYLRVPTLNGGLNNISEKMEKKWQVMQVLGHWTYDEKLKIVKPVHGCLQPPPQVGTEAQVQSLQCRRSCHSRKSHEHAGQKDDEVAGLPWGHITLEIYLMSACCQKNEDEEIGHLDKYILGLEIPVGDCWLQTLALVGTKLTWFNDQSWWWHAGVLKIQIRILQIQIRTM